MGGNKEMIKEKQKEKEDRYEELRKKYLYKNIKNEKPEQAKYYQNYVE